MTQTNKAFVVADLGGGTLDISAYKVIGTKPLRVEEVAASKCTESNHQVKDLDAKAMVLRWSSGFCLCDSSSKSPITMYAF